MLNQFLLSLKKAGKFLDEYKNWFSLLILAVIIAIGVYIRVQPLDSLFDPTLGKYISLELDSSFFYRYAQIIAHGGTLNGLDMLRAAPLGQPFGSFFTISLSYFVAYLWKFLSIFSSSITVEYVDVIYPIIAMGIMTLFLFLLVRRSLGWKVALIAALLINVIPAFLFRSLGGSSDHDILGMMFLMASLYLYFVVFQCKKTKWSILFALLAGVVTFLANAAFGSGIFVLTIIGITNLILLFLNKFDERLFFSYLVWFFSFNILLLIFGVSVSGFIFSLGTAPAYFAFLVFIVDFVLFKKNYLTLKVLDKIRLPNPVKTLIIALVLGSILLLIFGGYDLVISSIVKMYNYVFHAFQYSRVGLTVAENRKPYVVDWFGQFGMFYVLLFVAGAISLFYKLVKPASGLKNRLTISFVIFLILYVFSRYAPNTLLDGESMISHILFFGSIIFFVLYFIYLYFYSYYKNKGDYEDLSNFDPTLISLLIWFLLMVIGATTAVRLFNEFAPTTVIMVAIALVFAFDFLIKQKNNYVKYLGILVILLVLFSPFSFAKGIVIDAYQASYNQAKYSTPGYNQQWQLAGQWVRNNTSNDSIFVHWWDYGYWVQSGFERATVTDGGHAVGWWDYLIARDVLTATSYEEPLKFLKAHNVSYLLIIEDEIGKYPAYSSIGGDINDDRRSYIATFSMDSQATQEKRNSTQIIYKGQFVLDEDFVYGGKVYAKEQSAILAVSLLLKNVQSEEGNYKFNFDQPEVILYSRAYQPQTLKLQCIYLNGKEYTYDSYDFPGCFRAIPVYSGYQQQSPIGAGFFLSKRVYGSLFAKLYLLNQEGEYYKLVYNDENNAPLAIYNGQLIGPMRIWEINYPKNLTLSKEELEYNLRITYPDERLSNI